MTDEESGNELYLARRQPQTRLSPVWIVPIVALLIGLWLVYDNIADRGPRITLMMSDAEGIEAGSTLIKLLNVEVGRVEQVGLSEDFSHTVITARMIPDAENMLWDDTRFWVVKPRIGREGISGLNTVLSGVYIQLQPGQSESPAREFEVLNQPPVSAAGAQGIHIRLVSELGNSLRVGDPVSYQGLVVGRVEESEFDVSTRQMDHRLFIESPYDVLVTANSRFWSTRGIDLRLDSEGVRVSIESLETLLVGGVTFGYPEDVPAGEQATEDSSFILYPDEDSARQDNLYEYLEYVLLIDTTVRGLSRGAPVEYRGVRVGTVASVPWNFNVPQQDSLQQFAIPVLIRIEPERMSGTNELAPEVWESRFEELFNQGLRASLKAGNLLTGAMFVDLDLQSEGAGAYVADSFANVPVFPSTSGGLAQIEAQVTSLLNKLNGLEVEPVLASLEQTLSNSQTMLGEFRTLTQSFQAMLDAPETRALPENLNRSLQDLSQTLQGFSPDSSVYQELTRSMQGLEQLMADLQAFTRTLNDQPNALIFDRREREDPLPRAPR